MSDGNLPVAMSMLAGRVCSSSERLDRHVAKLGHVQGTFGGHEQAVRNFVAICAVSSGAASLRLSFCESSQRVHQFDRERAPGLKRGHNRVGVDLDRGWKNRMSARIGFGAKSVE